MDLQMGLRGEACGLEGEAKPVWCLLTVELDEGAGATASRLYGSPRTGLCDQLISIGSKIGVILAL